MINRYFRFVWLVMLFVMAAPLSHADTNPYAALRNLHQAQLDLNAVTIAFHRYQGSEGDGKLLVELNKALETLKASFQTSFQDLVDQGMKNDLEQIQNHWREAGKNLNSAMTAIAGKGFAEGQIANGYLASSYQSGKALEKAYKDIVASSGVKVSPVLQAVRNEQALFQEMTALYMETSSSQYGYTYRVEAGDETTLDKMAQQFGFGLDDLGRMLGGNQAAFKKLNNARNKWGFLEKSFKNYTENSVPYLVMKFGGEINSELAALGAEFDRN